MVTKVRGQYQTWYEDQAKKLDEVYITPGFEHFVTIFEAKEEISKKVYWIFENTEYTMLHWSIFTEDDTVMPTQIAFRCMTNYKYAVKRQLMSCPIGERLMKLVGGELKYRDIDEMENDDLTNLIRLVSDPKWQWRKHSKKPMQESKDEIDDDDEDVNESEKSRTPPRTIDIEEEPTKPTISKGSINKK
jgi:hypothetical protein